MENRVFVTGMGIISAIGNNLEENFDSLINKQHGISKLDILKTVHQDELLCGEIKLTNNDLLKRLDLPESNTYARTTLLSIIAAKEAFNDAGLNSKDSARTGVIVGTTVGGMDKSERFYKRLDENTDFIQSHNCGFTTEKVADYLDVNHFVTSLSTACSSGANAIMLGARLIKHGILDRAIVGGTDAISKFTLNGFKTLFLLDPNPCSPFDKDRKGLNLGEGAGIIVLEKGEICKNKKRYSEITGYANNNDAYHQTATSPDAKGPYLCMKNALEKSKLKPQDISYVNVHGTGTDNNDITEGLALEKIFENTVPPFSSTKAYTGHTLGAAGAIEAIYSILSIENNIIFPNLNFKQAIPELSLSPATVVIENAGIENVMSNSFGFGGNGTTLIFSKE